MNYPYIIGIVAAIVVIGALALTRMNGPDHTSTVTDTELDAGNVLDSIDTTGTNEPTETMQDNQQANVPSDTAQVESPAPETSAPASGPTTVVMKTNKGDVTIELLTDVMPITAGNFLKLAQADYYDGIKFHRIIDGFMIQGGDPLTKDDSQAQRWGSGGPGYTIEDEWGPGYSNTRGTLSMANAGPNTGGSQFFINTVDNVFLDGKHPVFGRVLRGMEVVDAISKVETAPGDRPLDPVIIEDIVIQ